MSNQPFKDHRGLILATYRFLNEVNAGLQIEAEVDEAPFDALALVLLLLQDEHGVVEELLKLLVSVVDAELLKGVQLYKYRKNTLLSCFFSELLQTISNSICFFCEDAASIIQRFIFRVSLSREPGRRYLKDLKASDIEDADEGGSLSLGLVQSLIDPEHQAAEHSLVRSFGQSLNSKLCLLLSLSLLDVVPTNLCKNK